MNVEFFRTDAGRLFTIFFLDETKKNSLFLEETIYLYSCVFSVFDLFSSNVIPATVYKIDKRRGFFCH